MWFEIDERAEFNFMSIKIQIKQIKNRKVIILITHYNTRIKTKRIYKKTKSKQKIM